MVSRRCLSVSGLPTLPGPGSNSPMPSSLGRSELPSPSALPSPLERHMPPLQPRGAGIDSPGRGGEGGTDEEPSTGEHGRAGGGRGGPAGPRRETLGPRTSEPPPVTRRHPGGVEGGMGGPHLPPSRTEPESHLREPGPDRPSDTPPLPGEMPTPADSPVQRREKEQRQQQRQQQRPPPQQRQSESAADPDASAAPDGQVTEEAVLPPPLSTEVAEAARRAASRFHRTGPADRHPDPDPYLRRRPSSEGEEGQQRPQGGLLQRIKQLFRRRD